VKPVPHNGVAWVADEELRAAWRMSGSGRPCLRADGWISTHTPIAIRNLVGATRDDRRAGTTCPTGSTDTHNGAGAGRIRRAPRGSASWSALSCCGVTSSPAGLFTPLLGRNVGESRWAELY